MKKRIYFKKIDEMKYISHLDFLKFLERLFKIASVKISYSNGYNPKPKFSFGNPISIGEEALYEPFDIEISEKISNTNLIKKLNSKAPKGFEILKVEDISLKNSISKDFNAIKYEISFNDLEDVNVFSKLLEQDKILDKKEKNGRIVVRSLSEKILFWNQKEDTFNIILENVSPNAYLRLANIKAEKLTIKRLRYMNIKEEEC